MASKTTCAVKNPSKIILGSEQGIKKKEEILWFLKVLSIDILESKLFMLHPLSNYEQLI